MNRQDLFAPAIAQAGLALQLLATGIGIQLIRIAEQAIEHVSWIDRDRQWRLGTRPGHGVVVGAAVAAVATSHHAGLIEPEFHRGDLGRLSELAGDDLIHRRTIQQDRIAFAYMYTRQEGGAGTGMITGAIAHRFAHRMIQALDDDEAVAERLHRRQRRGDRVIFANFRRRPVLHQHPIRQVEYLQPFARRHFCRAGR